MAQQMITKIPPRERADYPTPSTHSLKRKLDILLAQDDGELDIFLKIDNY